MPSPILSILSILLAAILGWIGGALINYLADVLPYRRRIAAPFCLKCQKPIPLVTYFLWPRRCPSCGERRDGLVWLVEAAAVALTVWLWLAPPVRLGFVVGWLVMVYFGVIVVIDIRYRLILHPVSIFGAVLGILIGAWQHGIIRTLEGGAAGFGFMLVIYYLGVLFARFIARGRGEAAGGEAIGFGDVNLGGVIGLLVGWPGVVLALFLALLFSAVFGVLYMAVLLLARRYSRFAAIPYGPFLVSGATVLIYFQEWLVSILPKA